MELRHLRYFIAVAECLNFTRAARQMGVAQPPLSVQIRRLEEELGTPLFARSNRKVTLTPAGAAFLPDARRILATADEAVRDFQDEVAGRAGLLRIVGDPSALSERVSKRLRKFARKHRGLRLSVELIDNQTNIFDHPGDVRILQTLSPSESALTLERGSVGIALPPKHRLLDRECIVPEDLVGELVLVGRAPSAAEGFVKERLIAGGIPVSESGEAWLTRLWRVSLALGVAPCASSDRFFGEITVVPFAEGRDVLHTVLEVDAGCKTSAITALIDFLRT